MSGIQGQKRADHALAAATAREMPGQWVLAATYNARATAVSSALQVRTGERLPHYRPAGSFEARYEVTQDGADLYVRYVDGDALRAAGFTASLASGLLESVDDFARRLQAADTTRSTP
ncbi:hypothetical protein [Streptomyces sp. NPDC055058]